MKKTQTKGKKIKKLPSFAPPSWQDMVIDKINEIIERLNQ